jgi:hypothetical protein
LECVSKMGSARLRLALGTEDREGVVSGRGCGPWTNEAIEAVGKGRCSPREAQIALDFLSEGSRLRHACPWQGLSLMLTLLHG